jgi:hypothetical protein
MKKIFAAAPLALAAAALLASPASARDFNYGNAGQLRAEIAQLDRQIDRSHGISSREERVLENRVDRLQSLYRSYARGGFTNREVRSLQNEIASVRVAIQRQAHDWNNHPGRNVGRNHR